MKVVNIHKRTIHQPKRKLNALMETLSTPNDKIWPYEKWPQMKFNVGLKVGGIGGHGPIRYEIIEHIPGEIIQFKFIRPKYFNGIHKFELIPLSPNKTELKHTIDMTTSGTATIGWTFVIRWLHHALMEDLFDKIENQFNDNNKRTAWNLWVRFLRKMLN